jgi:alpha-glucosidase
VVMFARPGGWKVVLNAGEEAIALPSHREVLVASCELQDGRLPGLAAVWLEV